MNKPQERDYTSHVAYTRALEEYTVGLEAERDAALAKLGDAVTFDGVTAFEWLGEQMFDLQNATGCNTAEEYTGQLETLKSALREANDGFKYIIAEARLTSRQYEVCRQTIVLINAALGEE